jgi:hypothetical protein
VSERDKDLDIRTRPADDVDWVRWRLARLVEQRLVAPFSPSEQEVYRALVQREHELLENRTIDLTGESARNDRPVDASDECVTGR